MDERSITLLDEIMYLRFYDNSKSFSMKQTDNISLNYTYKAATFSNTSFGSFFEIDKSLFELARTSKVNDLIKYYKENNFLSPEPLVFINERSRYAIVSGVNRLLALAALAAISDTVDITIPVVVISWPKNINEQNELVDLVKNHINFSKKSIDERLAMDKYLERMFDYQPKKLISYDDEKLSLVRDVLKSLNELDGPLRGNIVFNSERQTGSKKYSGGQLTNFLIKYGLFNFDVFLFNSKASEEEFVEWYAKSINEYIKLFYSENETPKLSELRYILKLFRYLIWKLAPGNEGLKFEAKKTRVQMDLMKDVMNGREIGSSMKELIASFLNYILHIDTENDKEYLHYQQGFNLENGEDYLDQYIKRKAREAFDMMNEKIDGHKAILSGEGHTIAGINAHIELFEEKNRI